MIKLLGKKLNSMSISYSRTYTKEISSGDYNTSCPVAISQNYQSITIKTLIFPLLYMFSVTVWHDSHMMDTPSRVM